MVKYKLHQVLIGVLVVFSGCVFDGKHSGAKFVADTDGWVKAPGSYHDYLHIRGQLVGSERVFEVRGEYEVEAERMLEEAQVVRLDMSTAKRLVGDQFREIDGYIPFLVRGVYYSKPTGKWEIHELGDKLQVAHRCLAKRGTRLQTHRQALVVLLKEKPAEVYVFCTAAE